MAAIPPEIKVIKAKIGCNILTFPGNIPTPSTPIPNKLKEMLKINFLYNKNIKYALIRAIIPTIIIVKLKIMADGWIVISFEGWVDPNIAYHTIWRGIFVWVENFSSDYAHYCDKSRKK